MGGRPFRMTKTRRITRRQHRTFAWRRFRRNIARTRQVLDHGLAGLEAESQKLRAMSERWKTYGKVKPGPAPKNWKPRVIDLPREYDPKREWVAIDNTSFRMYRRLIHYLGSETAGLRFHFYGMIALSSWGAFEMYMSLLFRELFERRPSLLRSGKTISYEDAVEHHENILEHLRAAQLEEIGHFSLSELLRYLESRINFRFSQKQEETLKSLYVIRNILAHNAGVVRPELVSLLPSGVQVSGQDLKITKVFLRSMLQSLEGAVDCLERHVSDKFWSERRERG